MTMTLVDFLTSNAVSAILFLHATAISSQLRTQRARAITPPLGIAGRPDQSSIVPGASFQFGRTSMRLPRAPHFAHFTLDRNHRTGVSPGYFDTSISA